MKYRIYYREVVLMTDFLLLEKIHRMIKGMPMPRLMFRKGISARGFFRPYMSLAEYTKADIFKSFDEITPVTVRFSSMLGDRGTADTSRNIKSMNVKFMSGRGQYDMICHNLPVFFIHDEKKFLELTDAFTKKELFDCVNRESFWRFIAKNPEAVNCMIRFLSNECLVSSFVDIIWYSANIAIWENEKGERFLVKYKWTPVAEEAVHQEKCLDRIAAEFMAGFDSDCAEDHLCSLISSGKFPGYELSLQMMEYEIADDPELLKNTVLWDEEENPPVAAGIMKLTEIPEDQRKECDLLSFVPGRTVDGIKIYRDGFTDLINYIYQTEAVERGDGN